MTPVHLDGRHSAGEIAVANGRKVDDLSGVVRRSKSVAIAACLGLVTSLCCNVSSAQAMPPAGKAIPNSRVMYNGGAAASYADAHWKKANSHYITLSDDCTNFVSQSLYAGGLPMTSFGQTTPAGQQRWGETIAQGSRLDTSWSTADTLYWYLRNWSGAASVVGSWSGSEGNPAVDPYTPNAVVTGDPISFDWTADGHIDHAALQTGLGNTSDGHNGNYIDQHTAARHHTFWSGWTYNTYRNTTRFDFLHMIS